tara:strand:+ start:279 stop:410 length:132 start_codon:yes stop_codon:yes gene_type:complete
MPVPLRRYYGRQLVKAKEREKDIYDKAGKNTSEEIARPTFKKS